MVTMGSEKNSNPGERERTRLNEHISYWLLELLETANLQITFFVTGHFFETFPDIVMAMRSAGHEIGYHGHSHQRIEDRAILASELAASKEFIQEFQPQGFRAPWVYLPPDMLTILKDSGFLYDSSSLAPPGVLTQQDDLWLLPVSTFRYTADRDIKFNQSFGLSTLRKEIPFGSGIVCSYLRRIYPNILDRYARRGQSCVFYLHLWQLFRDPQQSYRGIRRIHRLPLNNWLAKLVEQFKFGKLVDLCGNAQTTSGQHYMTFDIEI